MLTMMLSQELRVLRDHLDAIQKVIDSLKDRLERADKSFPDFQVIPFCEWNDRSITPPIGKIWASDGIGIWMINSDGKPIPKEAKSVKYWSIAFIPSPPSNK